MDLHLRQRLCALIDRAQREWRKPDHGIWEIRTEPRSFTYTAALYKVAVDRGALLAERLGLPGNLFDSLCSRANALGLLPEQIDPSTGAFLGNFPQGFSHIGLISSGVNLARLTEKAEK